MYNRSYHFIPANRPKLFDRTESLGADVYVFDLEDAVSREEKPEALVTLGKWIGQQSQFDRFFIRVNGIEDPLAETERAFLLKYPGLGVVLPKISSAASLAKAVEYYRFDCSRRIIGLIEDAAGLRSLSRILDLNILQAVGLGLEDFLSHSIFETARLVKLIDYVRSEIAIIAMSHGINSIDTISLDISGGEELQTEVSNAISAGFNGKFSIHPSQISAINEGFSPSQAIRKKASAIPETLNLSHSESGYLNIGGEIISPPKLKKFKIIQQFLKHHEITK